MASLFIEHQPAVVVCLGVPWIGFDGEGEMTRSLGGASLRKSDGAQVRECGGMRGPQADGLLVACSGVRKTACTMVCERQIVLGVRVAFRQIGSSLKL